ncbi:MAG: CocE/NonD family hydrolase [Chitinophagaceae bacterium]|nr:CocE/NonD family hydrolase [Chitinophagaceae bacterium]
MRTLLLFLLLPVFSFAQDIDSAWFAQHYVKKEAYIPMRDGVKLFTSIYMPKDKTKAAPILLSRTPYSCRPYGDAFADQYWNSYQRQYVKEGYIMVKQDVRGRWMSEGEYVNMRPFIPQKNAASIDESTDAYDTIDWLVKNIEHNNGSVGVFGISYPGFYSIMAAASNHPALKAVSPQAPATNWFIGDDFHHNGAFFVMDAFAFYSLRGKPRLGPMQESVVPFNYYTADNYKFYLEAGTLQNLSKYLGDSIAFWNDLMSHPNYDAWWKARDARVATKNLEPAMLWVGGVFDAEDKWGAWNAYLAAEKNNPAKAFNKIVMGPWYHGQWSSADGFRLGNIYFESNTAEWYQQNVEIPFFNYYLKGEGDVSTIAEAVIFLTGANEWRKFDRWPPAGKEDKLLYLQNDGKLSWSKPSNDKGTSRYISDPSKPVPYTEDIHSKRTRNYMNDDQRFAARRPDVLVFQTETLTEDVTVTGPIAADLLASISTTDADFVVKLIDVFPDDFSYDGAIREKITYPMGGYQMLVHGEIIRGKFRNSLEKPSPFTPGKIEKVAYTLGDIAHTFKKGHRIMVQIQSSWFPLADRNPQKFTNIYQAKETDFQPSTINIYHNKNNSSLIRLPVLK